MVDFMSRYLLLDRVFSRHHFEYQDDLRDEVLLSQTKQKCGFLFMRKLMAIGIKNILFGDHI